MEVILLQKVRNLGDLGDKVTVKPGYGRNYLIPQGHALPATKENVRVYEQRKAELEQASAERLEDAKQRAAELENTRVTVQLRASEEGKLYGSCGPHEIADALTEMGKPVENKEVTLPDGAIQELGEYEAVLQLHSDVEVPVTVIVEALEGEQSLLPPELEPGYEEESGAQDEAEEDSAG